MDKVDDYLEPQREAGVFHSAGDFTVSAARALRTSSDNRLGRWGMWAVKILQFLTAARAQQKIRIIHTRRLTRFEFVLPRDLRPSELLDVLSDATKSAEAALDHLRVGLLAVGCGEGRRFSVKLWADDPALYWDGRNFSDDAPSHFQCSKSNTMAIIISNLSLEEEEEAAWYSKGTLSRNRFLLASEQIEQRFMLGSARLNLDGISTGFGNRLQRFLEDRGELPIFFKASRRRDMIVPGLMSFELDCDRQVRLVAPGAQYFSSELLYAYFVTMDKRSFEAASPKNMAFHRLKLRPSTVYWLMDGVLVGKEKIFCEEIGFGASLFADASGLQTDASTMSLVQNETKERRKTEIEEFMREELQQLSSVVQMNLRLKPWTRKSEAGAFVGAVSGFGLGWAAVIAALLVKPALLHLYFRLLMGVSSGSGAIGAVTGRALRLPESNEDFELLLQEELRTFRRVWS